MTSPPVRTTATATAWTTPDGIVAIRIDQGASQSLEDAKENVATILALAGTARPPLLIDMSGSRALDPEVRHYYADRPLDVSFSGVALVAEATPLGRMMANLYLRVARNGLPMRLFTTEAAAMEWLRTFLATG